MNFGFLKSLKSSNYSLGVDIGTTSVKLVELEKSGNSLKLANYGCLEIGGYLDDERLALQSSSQQLNQKEAADLLGALLNSCQPVSKDAVASIPAYHTFTTLLEIPLMSDRDTAQAMQFQAKQHVPLPLDSVTVDWMRVGQTSDASGAEYQQILLVSVPNQEIQVYKNIFQAAGLNLEILEIEGVSLARSASISEEKPVIIVDIGGRSTSLSVASHGLMKATSQTDFSGASLTRTIGDGLGIKIRKAEELKRQRGLSGSGEVDLSHLMLPIIDVIINEVRRLKIDYEQGSLEKIGGVILSGGGSGLKGLAGIFSDKLGLPAKVANPFLKINHDTRLDSSLNELGPSLSVAAGLALRSFL